MVCNNLVLSFPKLLFDSKPLKMVYYHTSKNIKMMRNIIMDYGTSSEVSPCEYMKNYVEKCPEDTEASKLSWIVETFLGIQKHEQFLNHITSHMSEELTKEDQDYFKIIFYAITFQITPSDMPVFYKCLFNLSKPLLSTFTNFLGNNEVLTVITQLAQSQYDSTFITEKIIAPIFTWQPYISEMGHTYAEYVKKIESRKIKLPTIPLQSNMLNRKGKEMTVLPTQITPETPPNSIDNRTKKMLTRSAIDYKLKVLHNKNKQKALQLLNTVKTKDYHFAKPKSTRQSKQTNNVKSDIEVRKPFFMSKINFNINEAPVVRETAANIKRTNKRVQKHEQEEVQWLQDIVVNCKNTARIKELLQYDRQETERERLLDIEKKHLMGLISYEEAVIAKRKVYNENKIKYEEFLKEKCIWEEEIEAWKKRQLEKKRRQVEKLSLIELDMLQAKQNAVIKKKQVAEKLRKESEEMLTFSMKTKQEELEKKIKMIKEIKILAAIARKSKMPKIIDLTESSGVGFLCEMSIAELQERLSVMKIGLQENLEEKRRQIKEANFIAKNELEETKQSIQHFMADRATARQNKQKPSKVVIAASTEINDLRKVLEQKRETRKQSKN